ncbi:MAG: hypothetical protein GXO78_10650 [Calditrichaeota bacterium]|nr:hypothetical protein [Calditrichota bacterium]
MVKMWWMVCLLGWASLWAQERLADFQNRVDGYYQYLTQSDIQNFSCSITTASYIEYMKSRQDTVHLYPLRFTWMRDGRAFYILQALPEFKDENDRQEVLTRIQEVKRIFQGIFMDWQKYNIYSPVREFTENARFRAGTDTVAIVDRLLEGDQEIIIHKTYTRAGLLVRDIWQSGDLKIVNYPLFQEVDGRWVCLGWRSQIYQKGEVTSGMDVRMELVRREGQWMPIQFDILAQSRELGDQQVLTQIFLKDYVFNQDIQIRYPAAQADTTAREPAPEQQ